MTLSEHFRTTARANHLANRRLAGALAALTAEDFHAPRTSFFPGLARTLDHLLAVDIYYIAGLHGEADMADRYQQFTPSADAAGWARRQTVSDLRLIHFCDALDDAAMNRVVTLDRGTRLEANPLGRTLAHLAMHQTHHRGQVHAMLSGTAVKPPQLDDFLLPADAPARREDLAALGWTEAVLMEEDAQGVP
jgi:uncharacterized damage-inducible protein DinB